jgi:hypothetical protein
MLGELYVELDVLVLPRVPQGLRLLRVMTEAIFVLPKHPQGL